MSTSLCGYRHHMTGEVFRRLFSTESTSWWSENGLCCIRLLLVGKSGKRKKGKKITGVRRFSCSSVVV